MTTTDTTQGTDERLNLQLLEENLALHQRLAELETSLQAIQALQGNISSINANLGTIANGLSNLQTAITHLGGNVTSAAAMSNGQQINIVDQLRRIANALEKEG